MILWLWTPIDPEDPFPLTVTGDTRAATASPLVQTYLHALAAARTLVRLRDGRLVELCGVNRGCTRAKVRHHNRWLTVDIGHLLYVVDPNNLKDEPDDGRRQPV